MCTPRLARLPSVAAPLIVALLLIGCGEPLAPRILELETPRDTANTIGPYQVAAVVQGQAERATIEWRRSDSELLAQVKMARVDGQRWVGTLPGAAAGTDLLLAVRVEGPGGADRSPSTGFLGFRVLDGQEGPCLVDGDCPPGQICDRLRALCKAPPATCEDDGDCPQDYECPAPGEVCRFRTPDCARDADCPDGLTCLPSGRCAQQDECAVAEECPEGEICVGGECVPDAPPPSCEETGCPPREVCVAGECIPEVLEPCGGGCPEGQVCIGEVCVEAPSCADGCPDGLRCLEAENQCVECTADGMCPDGAHCDVGGTWACTPGVRGRACTPCGEGGLCGIGLQCESDFLNLCLPGCGDRGECPSGYSCDGRVCMPELFCSAQDCFFDEECPSNVCSAGACEPEQLCERDEDCGEDDGVPRVCVFGRCLSGLPSCLSPFDCGPGTVCMAGRCTPGDTRSACAECNTNADCGDTSFCAPVSDDGRPRCVSHCGQDGCGEGLECLDTGGGAGLCLDPEIGGCVTPPAPQPCDDDNLEPNDRLDEATRIGSGAEIDSRLCPDNEDWYRLNVRNNRGGSMTVSLMGEGRVSYALFTEDGEPMESGAFFQDAQVFEVPCGVGVSLRLSCEGCVMRYRLEAELSRCR